MIIMLLDTGADVKAGDLAGNTAFDYAQHNEKLMTAGGVVAALPPVILSLVLQRYLILGLTSGSVKG